MATSGSRTVKFTHRDKVLYPETGTTKGDVLDYYQAVATTLIQYSRQRPATRKRWVNGVGTAQKPEQPFFQKNLEPSAPSWVARRNIQHKDHVNTYPLVNDEATLLWCAQLAALEIHVPQWQFGPRGAQRNPDRLVLDLDPGNGAGLAECAEAARTVRPLLAGMGIEIFPLTSGSKGLHLYGRLDGKSTSDQVSAAMHELGRSLEADHPDLIVSDMKKAARRGKVLLDWSQNNGAKTTVVPYSLRGKPQPWVAAPRTWEELDDASLAQLTYDVVLKRLEQQGDLLAGLLEASAGRASGESTASGAKKTSSKLAAYRSKRDASKTSEPIPDEPVPEEPTGTGGEPAPRSGDAPMFVIQEHHASHLHWDFRLEHEGVLVSWALPKGLPESRGKNHLAVQTEDHPLEYGSFAGTIPKDQYGGGTVKIWDTGTFELLKWKAEEIQVILHGEKGAVAKAGQAAKVGKDPRIALIRTSGPTEKKPQWLIHLMKPESAATKAMPSTKASSTAKEAAPSAEPYEFMLASAGTQEEFRADKDFASKGWVFDSKWDGIRAQIRLEGNSLRITSRNGKDYTAEFPELSSIGAAMDADSAVLDGEIIALDSHGHSNFGLLQNRAKPGSKARPPLRFVAFDVLELAAKKTTGLRLDQRRELLENAVRSSELIQVSELLVGTPQKALAAAQKRGLEGLIAKRVASKYSSGKRSANWLKVKFQCSQEVVVIGWRPGNGERADTFGSLLLAINDDAGQLRYVGRAGTGFNEKTRRAALDLLKKRSRKTPPTNDVPRQDAADAHWVRPDLVGEVTFSEFTADHRLRHPVWKGFREDKTADQVRLESR